MAKKATIYTLPARHVAVVSGKVVGFGRTAYQAVEIAKAHGATEQEMGKWEKLLSSTRSA